MYYMKPSEHIQEIYNEKVFSEKCLLTLIEAIIEYLDEEHEKHRHSCGKDSKPFSTFNAGGGGC